MKQKFFIFFAAAWLLAACAANMPLPRRTNLDVVRLADTRWFQLERLGEGNDVEQASLLAVEQDGGGLRFVQTNALGAPVSRQKLDERGWSNDGFIAPNAESRRLFAAMLPLLAQNAAVYPDAVYRPSENGGTFEQQGRALWRTHSADGYDWITFPDGSRWRVKAVETASP